MSSHGILKSLRVRLPVYHESGERLSSIQQQQTAFPHGSGRVEPLLLQLLGKSFPVTGRCDDDDSFTATQSISEVMAHVFRKDALVVIELNRDAYATLFFPARFDNIDAADDATIIFYNDFGSANTAMAHARELVCFRTFQLGRRTLPARMTIRIEGRD